MTKDKLKKFGEINLGLFICAIGIAFFFWPTNFITGGASGLALLFELIFKVNNVIFLYTINILLLFVSLFTLGKQYFLKTLYASVVLPTMVWVLEVILKHTPILDNLQNIDLWIVVCISAVLMGIGVGLNLRADGGTGGMDVIESIMFKYFHIPYSASNYIINGLIIVGGLAFNGIESVLAAIIFLFLNGYIIDSITFGGFNRRAVFIKSEKSEEIKNMIINQMLRGCSVINAKGGFSGTDGEMLVCVCLSREYLDMRAKITEIDPNAFVFVTRATEVRGLGFTTMSLDRKKRLEARKKEGK